MKEAAFSVLSLTEILPNPVKKQPADFITIFKRFCVPDERILNQNCRVPQVRVGFLARSAALRAGLRRKEGALSSAYPALIPQRAVRASETCLVSPSAQTGLKACPTRLSAVPGGTGARQIEAISIRERYSAPGESLPQAFLGDGMVCS
jgi:hypothetical protein